MNAVSEQYDFLIALLKARTGQVFAPDRHWRIEMVLKPIMRQHSIPNLSLLISLLKSGMDSKLANDCVEAMINNETCFFRDQANFALMTGPLIDSIKEKRRQEKHLRIWSAACSTGQEAYSLAISFAENPEKWRDWKVEIIATDISETALSKANTGRFSQFEIQRGLPVTMMLKYFNQDGEDWIAQGKLRQMINFAKHNQLDPASHMGKFDLILCRNMLMYLSPENKQLALANISTSLKTDGYLMLGAAETVFGQNDLFASSREFRGFYGACGNSPMESGLKLRA